MGTHSSRHGEKAGGVVGGRARAAAVVRGLIEALVLALVCLSPWAYGADHPLGEFGLFAGIGVLLALWAVRMLLDGRLTWKKSPLALCLAGLFLLGVVQVVPLSRPVLERLGPGTAAVYDRLLPAAPEQLPDDPGDTNAPQPGSTLSLYRRVTVGNAFRLLAVFALFVVVRNNISADVGLKRLCVAATLNGTLLAVFGLLQSLTSPPNVVYWSVPSFYMVFGPFLCRNNFAFYINLCTGLALGLFLGMRATARAADGATPWVGSVASRVVASVGELLQRPAALAVCGGLALMLAANGVCQSRGAYLALAAGAAACTGFALVRRTRLAGWAAPLLAVGLAAALLAWLGTERIEARWATIWRGAALAEARGPLWARTLPLVRQFPVWGTGYGTFWLAEPVRRTVVEPHSSVWESAHNDFLELWIEGGLVGIALGLAALTLLFRACLRAAAAPSSPGAGGRAVGGLFAVTTMAVHSLGDFGLHIPAVAVLATVMAAHLSGLGSATSRARASRVYSLRLGGLAAVLGAAVAVAFGLVLYGVGWREDRVERLRLAALHAKAEGSPAGHGRRVTYLGQALQLVPGDAFLQFQLAQEHLAAAGAVGDPHTPGRKTGNLRPPEGRAPENPRPSREARDGLRHLLRARDLCPMLAEAHTLIAANVGRLLHADPPYAYLERACWLQPSDPEVAYLAGLQCLADGQPELAWTHWRRSLEMADTYLPRILAEASRRLTPEQIAAQVIPDRPASLLAAAQYLYPDSEAVAERRPLLDRALQLLDAPDAEPDAAALQVKGAVYAALDRIPEAVAAYEAALARDPQQADWRYQLAVLLHRQGRLLDARDQARTVVEQRPQHAEARALLDTLYREIAEKL